MNKQTSELKKPKTKPVEEHSFAPYIRILGKGRHGTRSLTRDEAFAAMSMICRYEVEPEQIGAFMMLLRVKEETAEEVAGFVEALRESIALPRPMPAISIDWSSYAGKRRQLPWYLLAALLLGRNGHPVFMHGLYRNDSRLYTREALSALDIEPSPTLSAAAEAVKQSGFAYLELQNLSPLAAEIFSTRELLGLRPPIHTVVRMLNPFAAPVMLQGVFHPNYAPIHQQAAGLLGQPRVLAFKGEGGEIERVPERDCVLYGFSDGEYWKEEWPALLKPGKYTAEPFPDLNHFRRVWEGQAEDRYGEQAVIGTLALALYAAGEASTENEAHVMARSLWESR